MDRLGPYTVAQIRSIVDRLPAAGNTKVYSALGNLDTAIKDLLQGCPVILLWRETQDFGHFILLHYRVHKKRVKPDLELFDPLGTTTDDSSWESYLHDEKELNDGGLLPYLQALTETADLSYNHPKNSPQESMTNSCGLWCILRAAFPDLSPSDFSRRAIERHK